jgi:hypothetical protein
MKTIVIRVDDKSPAFWERDLADVWESQREALGWKFLDVVPVDRSKVVESIRTTSATFSNSKCYLVTDQQLWGGSFDGADLATQLLTDRLVERAVVFSEIAALRPDHNSQAVIAETRILVKRAIKQLFEFLKTGLHPKTNELFELGKRIRGSLDFFCENVSAVPQETFVECLLRPTKAYGAFEGKPYDGQFLIDPWIAGFGCESVAPFSRHSAALFHPDVSDDVIQYLGGKKDEIANRKWNEICRALHPWESLEQASTGFCSATGAFRLVREIGMCGGQDCLLPDLLSEEHDLAPREKAWLCMHRTKLRHRIAEVRRGGGASLSLAVQDCIQELHTMTRHLALAEATRDEN